MRANTPKYLAGVVLAAVAVPALGHPGHEAGQMSALISGFAHPFTGLDHLLAMLAVGFTAAQKQRAIVPMAMAFVGLMLVGGLLGLTGLGLPHAEAGIALSVLVLGLALMNAQRLPIMAGAGLVALFAVFHGQAHGAEMPAAMSPALYFAGFAMGTLVLHLAGYGVGRLLRAHSLNWWPRLAGAGTVGAGALMLLGVA